MDFHATILEVILVAGVGSYIGFLLGLKSGVLLAATKKSDHRSAKTPAGQPSKSGTKESPSPTVS